MRVVGSAVSAFVVVALTATFAAAELAPERAVSEYHPAPGCPGEFTFRAQVQARTGRLVLVPAEQPDAPASAPRLVVWLRQEGSGYAGDLEIVRDGAVVRSTLEAPTCDEVVAGLSIAAALSVAPVAPEPLDPPAPPPSLPPVPPPRLAPHQVAPLQAWLVGASVGARFGYGPGATFAAGILTGQALGSSVWAWRAEASVAVGRDVTSSGVESIELAFTWVGGQADLCPLPLVSGSSLAVRACATLDFGVLRATATSGETSDRPWLAPGLALRCTARFGAAFLEPHLSLRAPLFRDQYWFRPNTLAFEVPWGAAEAGLAGGVAF